MDIVKIAIAFTLLLILVSALYSFNPAESDKSTSDDETDSTKEEPGFEAVFAVMGLIAIAYLTQKQKE